MLLFKRCCSGELPAAAPAHTTHHLDTLKIPMHAALPLGMLCRDSCEADGALIHLQNGVQCVVSLALTCFPTTSTPPTPVPLDILNNITYPLAARLQANHKDSG
jgi:hypothetical protein